ncbi:dcapl, putative [Pediculus humanus corporis]|uniref:Dcapl, putative n=1 Tax=Pediculus humanus subsp. corporis TaxID=121224 RepID=E0VI61_PEDHC|nr:dcapl, putative [Pediculus humanus corporis]EEB13067.1 dcapl, putative [Pediculus humanus corporis]
MGRKFNENDFFLFFLGVWSPTQKNVVEKTEEEKEENQERKKLEDEPIPPVWTPKSAQASPVLEKKEFRPVNFESPVLSRKKYNTPDEKRESSVPPPWQHTGGELPLLAKSPSSPALSLPKAPNPTVTLLQKAREGRLPRGAHYLNSEMNEFPISNESGIERLEIVSLTKSESDRPRKVEVSPKKIIGIGPTTKEGVPLVLRSELTDENREKWYKRMYDSLHKQGNDEDYVTVKYRTSPSRKGFGYQSEPESLTYDLSTNRYVTLDRRRAEPATTSSISVTLPRSRESPPRRDLGTYKNQPGRIEDYEPGHSSISELEANKWWDEVLEIFDRGEEDKTRPAYKTQSSRSFTNYASGYASDPQFVYKRTEDDLQSPPSSEEQKEAYRIIQKGGEIPLKGLRKPAPERPKGKYSPSRERLPRNAPQKENSSLKKSTVKYVESEVTIHYKSPVRSEAKVMLSEDELARRQAESMKRIYKEERRRKYLQELQDMNSRRHTDNFIPSQKSPIPLNRYDDFPLEYNFHSVDPDLVARGLYDFEGRRPRELAFRRGDIIYIMRRLDKNWCEGVLLDGTMGLFPLSYVEVIPYHEIMKYGRARAKYDFVPQTSLELPARKGDIITLTRKIDENWFEGKIGNRTGIIPASYCHVLVTPHVNVNTQIRSEKVNKPVAAPAAHSLIHDGSGLSSKHYYAPYVSSPNSPEFDLKRSNVKSATQPLNVRVNPRPEPALYQVLFNHVPNNDDELELLQGETVTVIEKCGDGWYIGSKTSDGKLGIFPGTHVRRIAPEFV